MQVSALTHVNYAFANIDNGTGAAFLTDLWADVQKTWPGDSPSANGSADLFGNLKQLYLHKKHSRNLKTLLSIGGWSYRHNFAPALAGSATKRQTFARTSVDLLKNLGFDGIDIDWEYPESPAESAALVDTCRRIRLELDNYARNLTGRPHFLLTLSVPAGPTHYTYFDVPGLMPYVDFWNLMAYDYMGSFSNYSGHQANVYKSIENPRSTDFDTIDPVQYYLSNGLPREDLVLGMPLYGRSFADTDGPGTKYTPATTGSLGAAGVWDYKVLPLNNSQEFHENEHIVASWSYGNESRLMVSYDTPCIARLKARYIEGQGLGGGMWWETSQDLPLNNTGSLIRIVGQEFKGAGGYAQEENVLSYPYSKYANLRAGMPGQ